MRAWHGHVADRLLAEEHVDKLVHVDQGHLPLKVAIPRVGVQGPIKRGGKVLLTEILLPRIARQARIEKVELDEGFQPCHPPFRPVHSGLSDTLIRRIPQEHARKSNSLALVADRWGQH